MPLMVEDLDRDSYVRCLRRAHGLVAAWEGWSCGCSPEWMHSLLENRRRQGLLERDLAWFGVVQLDAARPAMPERKDDASLLGSMYVMEGSTLGGQFIAKHVEEVLGLNRGEGDAYFRGHGERTRRMWKEFCVVLRTRTSESETEAVVAGAKAMFRAFGDWMRDMAR